MSDKRKEPSKSKPESETKKSETTILSPEELRAISGGTGGGVIKPATTSKNPGPSPGGG
jgi:hypothetical protein